MARPLETYAQRLRWALKRKDNMSSSKLARAMGIKPQAVSQVLNGPTKAFTAANNALAARILDIDPSWLATGQGEPELPKPIPEPVLRLAEILSRLPEDQLKVLLSLLFHQDQTWSRAA